jgi:CBS domain-containing protein
MPNRPIQQIIEGRKLITAAPDMLVSDAAKLMRREQIGAVLVVSEGHLTGIFTERDALNRVIAEGLSPEATKLVDVMTPDPITLTPDHPIGHALHLMYENGFRHVPIAEGGRPVGMVSARDALGLEVLEFEHEMQRREEISEIL